MGVEECDDGNQANGDACLNVCQNAACGDGFVHEGFESATTEMPTILMSASLIVPLPAAVMVSFKLESKNATMRTSKMVITA